MKYRIDRELISNHFNLNFEYHHHMEYIEKVVSLIIWQEINICDDDDFFEYNRIVNEIRDLLRDDLYYNDPDMSHKRTHEELVNLFDEKWDEFIDSPIYAKMKEKKVNQ